MKSKPIIRFFNFDKSVFVDSDEWEANLSIVSCQPLEGYSGVYMILIGDLVVRVNGRSYVLSSPQYDSSKIWLSNQPFDPGYQGYRQSGFYQGYHRCPGPKIGSASAKSAILRWVIDNKHYKLNGGGELPEDAGGSFRKCFSDIKGLFDEGDD